MLIDSLTGNGLSDNSKSKLKKELKESSKIKEKVKKEIKKSKNNYISYEGTIEYNANDKERDLYLSVGKANIKILGIKESKQWKIGIIIWDTYDFDEYRKGMEFGAIANNIGYTLQQIDNIIPYEWKMQFIYEE